MKNIRLTNDMRDTFIAKAMADVPSKPFPDLVRDAANKAAHDALPPAVKKMLKDPALAGFVAVRHVYLNDRDGMPAASLGMSFQLPSDDDKALKRLILESIAGLLPEWSAQVENHKSLRAKLKAVAYHCTTRNQLAEAFPEFAQYLPAVESDATRNLPALANVVTDFVKAGWPKGGKVTAAKAA